MQTASGDSPNPVRNSDRPYHALLDEMAAHFATASAGVAHLFTTNASNVFDVFLDALPDELRQEHRCRACAAFVKDHGALVTIDADGRTDTPFWPEVADVAPEYRDAIRKVRQRVTTAKVTGVFRSESATWGRPEAGGFRHFHAVPPPGLVSRPDPLHTNGALMARLAHEHHTLVTALSKYGAGVAAEAQRIIRTGELDRTDKAQPIADWFAGLHRERARVAAQSDATPARVANVVWRATAEAPAGWPHVGNTIVGTLLDDVAAGLPFDRIKARWTPKTAPLAYQRPQAPPKAGAIDRAEVVFERLGLAPALARRFAVLADIPDDRWTWRPKPAPQPGPAGEGVFAHLRDKPAAPAVNVGSSSPVAITWEKFARTVLPDAAAIQFVPAAIEPLYMLTTARDPAAPPMLRWDFDNARNPLSWYTYSGASQPRDFGLTEARPADVLGFVSLPDGWANPTLGTGVLAIVDGCRDLAHAGANGLWPESLRAELHEIRSVIERHNKSSAGTLTTADAPERIGGVGIRSSSPPRGTFRVRGQSGGWTTYRIDRWD